MWLNSSSISASVILLPSILFEEPTDSIAATRFITFNSAGVKFNAPACQESINWSSTQAYADKSRKLLFYNKLANGN